ncbi:deoxyribonuclease IV [Methanosarcina sp.]|jgi:deoxyribonuclease-4|uniref:deoxyribonuclease IV n=1 Tax=Methanosarcina sp. TaxID=2213 RepID=UPI002988E1D4|nr:deoxyribonuclease IV [Methanosarcina sp.]MDW5551681.1 deoxyribonuclease IV [Methanosarcina sp.]MDW5553184.1 deoxyribonuclease IV [Methanosarcina sp.]MDW5558353.1 deoxyribonuclease IV [Methanosarcina sp.]
MTSKDLLFGTGGIPRSTKGTSSISGIKRIRELGLDCMELEFVQGVRMGEKGAKNVLETANKEEVALSVHAPYYINLNSYEEEKLKASLERIYEAAKVGSLCGAESIVLHAGFYQKSTKKHTFENISKALKELTGQLRDEGIQAVLRPETMGKRTQFGTLEEVLALSAEIEGVMPCLDFCHLHAREGKENSYSEFTEILSRVEENLGKQGLSNMHMHISGVEYGTNGEKRHLTLKESDLNYPELMKALKEFKAQGRVILESPILEEDALMLRKLYNEI